MKYVVSFALLAALAGCAGQGPGFLSGFRDGGVRDAVLTSPDPAAAPKPETDGAPFQTATVEPDEDARTVEEFDTTTPEDRAAALTPAPAADGGDGRLGTTIASLGDPAEPGFWIKTPLVSEPMPGRIVYVVSGRSVQVELRPLDGPVGGGSQVSLAAMRLLDAPLAGLPELIVFRNEV